MNYQGNGSSILGESRSENRLNKKQANRKVARLYFKGEKREWISPQRDADYFWDVTEKQVTSKLQHTCYF